MKTLDAETRRFALAAVTLCATFWDVAFNLGVYGEVFFERYLGLWVVATAALFALMVSPTGRRALTLRGRVMLLVPNLYFVAACLAMAALRMAPGIEAHGTVGRIDVGGIVLMLVGVGASILSALALLFALPYTLWVVASVVSPDLVGFERRRTKVALAAVVAAVVLLAFGAGRAHDLYLGCHDFRVSGNDTPAGCFEAPAD